jgi:hypothetical protein
MSTIWTHPPDINWNELVAAFLARVIHIDMFGQTIISPESVEHHLMYKALEDEKDYLSGLQSGMQQCQRGVICEH